MYLNECNKQLTSLFPSFGMNQTPRLVTARDPLSTVNSGPLHRKILQTAGLCNVYSSADEGHNHL